jgi:hypothetical protein
LRVRASVGSECFVIAVRHSAVPFGGHFMSITYLHATVSPGARLAMPWRPDFNALVYVLSGRGTVGTEGRPLDEGELAVFGPGDA